MNKEAKDECDNSGSFNSMSMERVDIKEGLLWIVHTYN